MSLSAATAVIGSSEFELEMALDRDEGRWHGDLRSYLRAAAHAHHHGQAAPIAPSSLVALSTWRLAQRALACPLSPNGARIVGRGRRLGSLVIRPLIDREPAVASLVRQPRSWHGLAALARRRNEAAERLANRGYLALVCDLDGTAPVAPVSPSPQPTQRGTWRKEVLPALTPHTLAAMWSDVAGDEATPEVLSAPSGRPASSYPQGDDAIVVVPLGGRTLESWAVALHELGHAWAARHVPTATRVCDEAIAMWWSFRLADPQFVQRVCGADARGSMTTAEAIALAARAYHEAMHTTARWFAGVEASLYGGSGEAQRVAGTEEAATAPPPWALWFEGGAQAAYANAARCTSEWQGLGLTELGHRANAWLLASQATTPTDPKERGWRPGAG